MTLETALEAGPNPVVEYTLLIDGIPVLFGTKAGLVHPLDNVTNPPAGGLTSVDAIDVESLQLGELRFDYNKRMAPPSEGSGEIIIRPEWQRWFELRTSPVARLTSKIDEDDTVITPNRAVFFEDDVLFCQRETMLVTENNSGALTVTRNYCALPNNKAAAHQGSSEIRSVPRHLYGRAAELRIWPSTDPADSRTLRYLILAGSPVHAKKDGVWQFDFDTNMRRFDKKVATGFKGADLELATLTTIGTGVAAVPAIICVPSDNQREFRCTSELDGSIAVGINGEGFIADILSNNPNPIVSNPVGFASVPGFQGSGNLLYVAPTDDNQKPWSLRRCYVFTGNPLQCMIQVLLSDCGQLTNHPTYDTLFGLTSTATTVAGRLSSGDQECRFGAAIPADLIEIPDDDDPLMTEVVAGFCFVLMDEMNALEVIWECCSAQNLIAYINEDQKLAFKKMDTGYPDDVVTTTLDADTILHDETEPTSVDDESEVIHTASVQCNYSVFRREFLGKTIVKDFDLVETYRDAGGTSGIGTLEVVRRSLLCALPGQRVEQITYGIPGANALDVQTLLQMLDRELVRRRSIRKYTTTLPAKCMTLRIVDRASLTWEHFIDFAGGTVSGFAADIMAIRFDVQNGHIITELHEVRTGKLIAPTGRIHAWNAGLARMTLLSDSEFGGGTTPGDYFSVGDVVRILDYSSSPQYSTMSGALAISAKTASTVTVTGAVGFVPADGDLLVLGGYDEATGTVVNVAQSQKQHDYLYMADANGLIGSSNAAADRWG